MSQHAVKQSSSAPVEPLRQSRWQRPVFDMTLISRPQLNPDALRYAEEVLRSGWWGYGPVAHDLQALMEQHYQGEQSALATSSCTAALHLSLLCAGVGPGDEVIVPSLTYVSTAIGAVYCGAEPVFADVDPHTLCLSAATVERALSPRTKAIIPMHYAGPAQDFEPIRKLVEGRGITVIEDGAHAFGSKIDGRMVGADAAFCCLSFAPTKQIASSNGGILLFKDKGRREEINQRSFLGLAVDTYGRTMAKGVSPVAHVARIGNKYKIDDLAAAVAYGAVERMADTIAYRAKLVDRYYAQLGAISAVELLPRAKSQETSWYIMPIRVPDEAVRDQLRAHLAEHKIGNTVHYPSLQEQPAFRQCRGELPVTARESRRLITLPLHEAVPLAEVDRICEVIARFFK